VGGGALTVSGTNFGADAIAFVAGHRCERTFLSEDHSELRCTAPPLEGSGLLVVVANSDQRSDESRSLSGFDPRVVSVSSPVISSVASVSGRAPSSGGFLLEVVGRHFSRVLTLGDTARRSRQLALTPVARAELFGFVDKRVRLTPNPGGSVESAVCEVLIEPSTDSGSTEASLVRFQGGTTWSDSRIVCLAPPGYHPAASVSVEVAGLMTVLADTFAYDRPSINFARPSDFSALGGSSVSIQGLNFPLPAEHGIPLRVSMSPTAEALAQAARAETPVESAELVWLDGLDVIRDGDSMLRTTLVSMSPVPRGILVGWRNLTVTAGNRSSAPHPVLGQCPAGHYGAHGEYCQPCPVGASCAGGADMPVALAGFFPVAHPEQFAACKPMAACLPGNQERPAEPNCRTGYGADMCASCVLGFRRLQGMCEVCPDEAWILIVAGVVAVMSAAGVAMYLQRKRVNLAAGIIAVDFLQVITLISSFEFDNIPVELRLVYLYISGFSFNVELLAVECT